MPPSFAHFMGMDMREVCHPFGVKKPAVLCMFAPLFHAKCVILANTSEQPANLTSQAEWSTQLTSQKRPTAMCLAKIAN
jgi:hypothetical protein